MNQPTVKYGRPPAIGGAASSSERLAYEMRPENRHRKTIFKARDGQWGISIRGQADGHHYATHDEAINALKGYS